MSELIPVILAGGVGTRLWPRSRKLHPKQFQPLVDERSPFLETLLRLEGMDHDAPIVVAAEEHRFLVDRECERAGRNRKVLILEPEGRNTAPAVALAAFRALEAADDPVLLVLPSDHHIADRAGFQEAVLGALGRVDDHLVTFGVVPEGPETGYGYIRRGRPLADEAGAADRAPAFRVEAFVEKPDLERARGFVSDGRHYWNSGMFLFRATSFLEELERYRPDIHAACRTAFRDGDVERGTVRPADSFAECPSQSIDYAVMEWTKRAAVVPVDVGWNDLGSWSAIWETSPRDGHGNSIEGDVLIQDVRNSLVHAGHRLVAVSGVDGVAVVETDDALLVTRLESAQRVGDLVGRLRASGRPEHESGGRDFRPWGSFRSVEVGPGFQVKRITVNPGGVLSLQSHEHRAEHWVVVAGVARVRRDDETFILAEGESTYIPLGAIHRLENPGNEPLELIEVQLGSYLGEDDIVRLEDRYGRTRQGAPLA